MLKLGNAKFRVLILTKPLISLLNLILSFPLFLISKNYDIDECFLRIFD